MTHVITWHCTAVATLAPIESDGTFKVRHFLVLPVMAGLAKIEKDCHIHYNMLLIVKRLTYGPHPLVLLHNTDNKRNTLKS